MTLFTRKHGLHLLLQWPSILFVTPPFPPSHNLSASADRPSRVHAPPPPISSSCSGLPPAACAAARIDLGRWAAHHPAQPAFPPGRLRSGAPARCTQCICPPEADEPHTPPQRVNAGEHTLSQPPGRRCIHVAKAFKHTGDRARQPTQSLHKCTTQSLVSDTLRATPAGSYQHVGQVREPSHTPDMHSSCTCSQHIYPPDSN